MTNKDSFPAHKELWLELNAAMLGNLMSGNGNTGTVPTDIAGAAYDEFQQLHELADSMADALKELREEYLDCVNSDPAYRGTLAELEEGIGYTSDALTKYKTLTGR